MCICYVNGNVHLIRKFTFQFTAVLVKPEPIQEDQVYRQNLGENGIDLYL